MTRTATQMARLKEAAQYFPVFTRPLPGDNEEQYSLRRGCFACQHEGKSSLSGDHRFATVWFNAINAGKPNAKNLIQPLGGVVIDLHDKASATGSNKSIIPVLKEANTAFPKLWVYYITPQTFKMLDSPYVRLFVDRSGNLDHINARISLWNNLLTKEEQADEPADITLTIQPSWGTGIYLDPTQPPKGLVVNPENLITATKAKQKKLLHGLQGEQQLTRIEPHKKTTPKKEKLIEAKGGQPYADIIQDAMAQSTYNWATTATNTVPTWSLTPIPEEDDFAEDEDF